MQVRLRCPALLGLLLLTSCLGPSAAVARPSPLEPVEVMQMATVLKGAKPGTLVVFDIDNTLIESAQTLGSDQWYYHLVRTLQAEKGLSAHQAEDEAMVVWNAVQADTQVRCVDPKTPAEVRRLIEAGISVMALTARTHDVAPATQTQLASVGIDLAGHPVHPKDLELVLASSAFFKGGVLYVGEHNNKGEVLVAFLKKTGLSPQQVIFVDDKDKHVRSVLAALTAAKVPVQGFRMGAADARVKAFDPKVADLQFRCWQGILSDEEARRLLARP